VVYRLVAPTLPGRQAEVQRVWTALAVDVFQHAAGDDAAPLLRAVTAASGEV
jgi:hypothetical protein